VPKSDIDVAEANGQPSWLDRSLRIFTDVRAGEGATALMMFANVFLVLCSYYFVKPIREGWLSVSDIEGFTKMEIKAYSSFGQALLLIPVVSGFARLSNRLPRGRLITYSTLFCMSNMVVFWALQPGFFISALPVMGLVFYLWVGMFGVFVVAQFWAFAADVYTNEAGKRMLPVIAIGATAGAASGSWITDFLLQADLFGSQWLLIVALVPLGVSIVLTLVVDRKESPALHASEMVEEAPEELDEAQKQRGALTVIFESRYLIGVAVITLLLNWVNTSGETLLYTVVQENLEEQALGQGVVDPDALLVFTKDGTASFYANFYGWVNVVALVLQAFVASRLLKYGGFGPLLLMLPVVALISYAAMALIPVLAIVKFMKVAENATDYSINNTARNVIWLPVPSEDIYKGKPALDTLFARFGDGLSALTVMIGVNLLMLSTVSYFVINVALVVVWLAVSFIVIREHSQLVEEEGHEATA
jgi:AAA family ATP:ADP antiporter